MAESSKAPAKSQTEKDRDAELAAQKKVQDAVDAATRDKNGTPKPIVP